MTDENIKIVPLSEEEWKGTPIMMVTESDSYYDVEISDFTDEGCSINIVKKPANPPIKHTPEEYDFPDRLFEDHWENALAWGVVGENKELLACIEVCPEEWSNRLAVTELWVHESLRHKGVAHRLMEIAKDCARQQKRRALMLETQSCNVNALGFYRHEGFELMGIDRCCYQNNDIERREVRFNMVYFFDMKGRFGE